MTSDTWAPEGDAEAHTHTHAHFYTHTLTWRIHHRLEFQPALQHRPLVLTEWSSTATAEGYSKEPRVFVLASVANATAMLWMNGSCSFPDEATKGVFCRLGIFSRFLDNPSFRKIIARCLISSLNFVVDSRQI